MKRFVFPVVCAVMATAVAQPKYPAIKPGAAADTWFGKTYPDPYRWLEDIKNKEVEAWFKSNADLTDSLMAKIPGRDALAKEWLELDKLKPAQYGYLQIKNGRVFYKKTLGGENTGKLFYRDGLKGAEKLLFDPSTYKKDVVTTVNSTSPSWDGKYVALGLTSGGAEYSEIRIIEVATKKLLPESFFPSYGPGGWLADNKSFFYDAGNTTDLKANDIELNRHQKLHVIGTDFAKDRDVFSSAVAPELAIEPKEFVSAAVPEDRPELLIGNIGTVQNELKLYAAQSSDLKGKKINWRQIAKPTDNLVRGFELDGDWAYAVTHSGAPKYKVVRTSFTKPDWSKAEVVLPEAADSIQYITKSKSFLFIIYSNGVTSRIVKYDLKSKKQSEIKVPGSGGTVGVFCPEFKNNKCLAIITGWTAPVTIYDYDADKDTFAKSIFNSDVTYPGFDQLISEEVEVPSHDGTMVPLSIIRRKDLKLDGNNSAILDGYGAYGISATPGFSTFNSIALRGVVVANCHPRGGSEKGEAWYKAGYKTTKPNTWKDFIACGEYLVKKGYTSKAKLAGMGTSAGGVLISRAVTERPDLFAAAVCNVCVANALRAEFSPNGPVNTPEFGTVKIEDEAKALAEMDGVAHVKKGVKYPAMMAVAGWNDPRVSAWQPGKLAAAMQAATASNRPVLMKVNYDNGHFTEEKQVTFKNFADMYGFMLWQTGHRDFQPK